MEIELARQLADEMERGGRAYIRNLAAAERAILDGRFNTAKILRAAAHAQRAMAMEAARLLQEELGESDVLNLVLEEIGTDKDLAVSERMGSVSRSTMQRLEQSAKVRAGLRDVIRSSLTSLQSNSDVLESDVAQILWGCYSCGAILEGAPPHSCPVCGALSVEFEGFGPFYSGSAEHLGQLVPEDIINILEAIPSQVEAVITMVDDAALRRKPSSDEWCVAETVGHMLETDRLFAMRVQALLESQGAELPRPMPPWKLHEGKGYETMQAAELIAHMRTVRSQSLDLVRTMTAADWSRKGLLQGSKTSMLDLGTWLSNHDRGHLAQIQRLCEI